MGHYLSELSNPDDMVTRKAKPKKAKSKPKKAAQNANRRKPKTPVAKKETLSVLIKRLESEINRLEAEKKVEIHHHHYTSAQPLTAEDLQAWGRVGGPSGLS